MHSFRYPACLLASVFCSIAALAQPATLRPLEGNFRALTQNDSRIFGLDFAGTLFSSDNEGGSFTQRYPTTGIAEDFYYAVSALGDTVVIAGGDALIARSADNGVSWDDTVNTVFVQGDLKAIAGRASATPALNQWVAAGNDGGQGVLFVSQNDGMEWTRHVSGTSFDNLDFSGAVWTGAAWVVCGSKTLIPVDAEDYPGVIYRSVDALSWTLVDDTFSSPLRAIASDGAGRVVAVGERGLILRSTDHGQTFEQSDQSPVSEDLTAVVAAGVDNFIIGGVGKSLLEVNAEIISVRRPLVGGAPQVEALLLVNGDVLLGGAFSASSRTEPFGLKLETLGGSYRLTVSQALSGKVYSLETSSTLQDWDDVPNTARAGADGSLRWTLPLDGERRFWRATEF
jgi:photosystem II stability/assembly factor-like uncharacterized protein